MKIIDMASQKKMKTFEHYKKYFSKKSFQELKQVLHEADKNENIHKYEALKHLLNEYIEMDGYTDFDIERLGHDIKYSGFIQRFFAGFIDFLILGIPVLLFFKYSKEFPATGQIAYKVISTLAFISINLFLLKVYGGTPGKLFLGLKVIRVDGENLKFKNAFLRESVYILNSTIQLIVFLTVVDKFDFDFIKTAQSNEIGSYWRSIYPRWSYIIDDNLGAFE